MQKIIFLFVTLFISLWSHTTFAAEKEPISFGQVEIGDTRLPLKASHFDVKISLNENVRAKVILRKGSIQWVRVEDVLLTPRGRLAIFFAGSADQYHIRYRDKSLLLQQKNKYAYTEFFVSLFQNDPITIYKNGKYFGKVTIAAKTLEKTAPTTLIDYSCARKNIEVIGMEGEYISLGCRTHRIGDFGKEVPMMEVVWTTANYRLLDNSQPPYMSVFLSNSPVKLKVKNNKGEVREITIKAKIPKRMHRLNVAYGFGPYFFETSYTNTDDAGVAIAEPEIISEPVAPAFMLYFNFKLSDDASVRGFDAAVWKQSSFNNAGVYFANDVAKIMDNKLTITTLIGMQYLYFKFDESSATINEPIFPQGIEFLYKHAFGIENYVISGGMFLSPSESIDYQNLWIRWGKNYFWELNYIYWGKEEFTAKMYGLSLGFLFDSYL